MISDNKPHTRCVNSARRVPGTASSSHLRCTAQSALAGSWCGAVTQSAPSEPCRPQQRSELRSAQRPFQSSTPSQQVAQRQRQRRHPPQRQLPRQLQRRRCSLAVRLAELAASPRRILATRGFGCHLAPSPAGSVRRSCPGSTPRCGGRHTSAHSAASPGPTPDEHTPSRNSRNPTVTAMLNHVRIAPAPTASAANPPSGTCPWSTSPGACCRRRKRRRSPGPGARAACVNEASSNGR